LLRLRHDILHFLVLKSLGKDWQEETPLSNYFNFLPDEYARKTPDVVFFLKITYGILLMFLLV